MKSLWCYYTPEMEQADNTYLDGHGESALKPWKGRIPRRLNQEDMADIILACAGALRGVVRELIGAPFNT